jgi:hypothetical protein
MRSWPRCSLVVVALGLLLATAGALRAQTIPRRSWMYDPQAHQYAGRFIDPAGHWTMVMLSIYDAEGGGKLCVAGYAPLGSAPGPDDLFKCKLAETKLLRDPKSKQIIGLYYRSVFCILDPLTVNGRGVKLHVRLPMYVVPPPQRKESTDVTRTGRG